MSTTIGILGIVLAFALLIIMALKNMSPIYVGFLVTLVVIITSGLPLVSTITDIYMPGVASFVSGYFCMMAFGAVMGKLYDVSGGATAISHGLMNTFMGKNMDKASETKRITVTVLAISALGGILCYGGVNNVVLIVALYPFAASMCKMTNIPRRFAMGMVFLSTCTFAYGGPFTPQMPNVTAMDIMGTSSTAALIPGLVAVISEVVFAVFGFNFLIKRAWKRGESFEYGPHDTPYNEAVKLPNPWFSILPLAVVFVLFNLIHLNIVITLFIGCILSIILFWPYLGGFKKMIVSINEGAKSSCSSLLFISAIVGFGSVATATPAYQAILQALLGLDVHPYIQLVLTTFGFSALAGSATVGVKMALPTLGPIFTAAGYPAAALHRIAAIACNVTDSLPSCGAIPMACDVAGTSMKDGYPAIFLTAVLSTFVGTLVVTVLCILFPSLAMV